MGKLLLALTLALILGAACATTSRMDQMEARLAGAESDVQRGQVYYEHSCDRCHALYMPESYDVDEWRFFVRKYGRKARLSKEERHLVFNYLSIHAGG